MKRKDELLTKILAAEAKEADWGAKASVMKREYCKLFSPIQKGDKVLFNPYSQYPLVNGIVTIVKYNSGAFRYQLKECTKDWEFRKRRNPIWINPIRTTNSIEKI